MRAPLFRRAAAALLTTGLIASFLLGSHGFPPTVWRLVGFGGSSATFALVAGSLFGHFEPTFRPKSRR